MSPDKRRVRFLASEAKNALISHPCVSRVVAERTVRSLPRTLFLMPGRRIGANHASSGGDLCIARLSIHTASGDERLPGTTTACLLSARHGCGLSVAGRPFFVGGGIAFESPFESPLESRARRAIYRFHYGVGRLPETRCIRSLACEISGERAA